MATLPKKSRQKRALAVLENQLILNTKTVKKTLSDKVELSGSDKNRIQREIDILRTRV